MPDLTVSEGSLEPSEAGVQHRHLKRKSRFLAKQTTFRLNAHGGLQHARTKVSGEQVHGEGLPASDFKFSNSIFNLGARALKYKNSL